MAPDWIVEMEAGQGEQMAYLEITAPTLEAAVGLADERYPHLQVIYTAPVPGPITAE